MTMGLLTQRIWTLTMESKQKKKEMFEIDTQRKSASSDITINSNSNRVQKINLQYRLLINRMHQIPYANKIQINKHNNENCTK